jgi:hypothetical protein
MTILDKVATKLKYTPATPSTPGSKPTYAQERSFACNYSDISAQETVRAGRNASNREGRVHYFPARVSFNYGDRIVYDGATYEIMYVPQRAHYVAIDYVEVKAQQ